MYLLSIFALALGAFGAALSDNDSELSALSQLVYEMKADGRLPGLTADAHGGEFSAYAIKPEMREESWFQNDMATAAQGCTNLFAVDVEHRGTVMKYLFCHDQEWQLKVALKKVDTLWELVGESESTKSRNGVKEMGSKE